MGWRASEPSPLAGSRPSEGADQLPRRPPGLPPPAAWDVHSTEWVIYLNKGAKAGCSGQTRASTGQPGHGALPGPRQGIRLPGTWPLWGSWTRSRSAPASEWHQRGLSEPPTLLGRPLPGPSGPHGSQKAQGPGVGFSEEVPEALALGLDRVRNWATGGRSQKRSQCRLRLGGDLSCWSPTSSLDRQAPFPPLP